MSSDTIGPLEHIREAAGYIAADTAGMDFEAFEADRRTRQLVERNFEIIGEAMHRLRRHAPELVDRISTSHEIVGFRNHLAHGYDKIDQSTVWRAVQEKLPILRDEVDALLREIET
ncbi:MAG: DUF86 domain-containing protein [Thermomicrobiales bacterium]|nr:DUF86 domain-containing protein [Thermomicrobiales bacterium]